MSKSLLSKSAQIRGQLARPRGIAGFMGLALLGALSIAKKTKRSIQKEKQIYLKKKTAATLLSPSFARKLQRRDWCIEVSGRLGATLHGMRTLVNRKRCAEK